MKENLLIVGMMAAALMTTAHAAPGYYTEIEEVTVTIPMDGQQALKGQNTIKLKQEIKKIEADLDLSKADLKKVSIKAKSAAGNGSVYVSEGQFDSREKTIDKSPKAQGFQQPGGFSVVNLNTPREMEGVAWQAHLKGNIKIKRIDVTFDMPVEKQNVQAQCGAELKGLFGASWDNFSAQAQGKTKNIARAKACQKALNKCEARVDQLEALIPDVDKFLRCVRK